MSEERPYLAPVPITARHMLASFRCGNQAMDSWLKNHALDNEGKASRTYIVTDRADNVIAYYSLAMGRIDIKDLPRRLRHNLPPQVPVTVLGRLAVDNEHSGRGIGSGMLRAAMAHTLQVAQLVGLRALVVQAIDDNAVAFYSHYGFQAFPGQPRSLILPIETIAAALDSLSVNVP